MEPLTSVASLPFVVIANATDWFDIAFVHNPWGILNAMSKQIEDIESLIKKIPNNDGLTLTPTDMLDGKTGVRSVSGLNSDLEGIKQSLSTLRLTIKDYPRSWSLVGWKGRQLRTQIDSVAASLRALDKNVTTTSYAVEAAASRHGSGSREHRLVKQRQAIRSMRDEAEDRVEQMSKILTKKYRDDAYANNPVDRFPILAEDPDYAAEIEAYAEVRAKREAFDSVASD